MAVFQGRGILIFATIFFFAAGIAMLLLAENLSPKTPKPVSDIPAQTSEQIIVESDDEPESALGLEGEQVTVTKVIDGDTFEIQGGDKVRLLGIDTPETVDPRRPVGCYGKEASNKLKSLIEGQVVIMQKDISETDKYKRLLRYVYLPLSNDQFLFVNDYLIRQGFAQILTYPPDVAFSQQFLEAQTQAKVELRGLWGGCKN